MKPSFFYLLALLKTPGVGSKISAFLLQQFETPENIFELERKTLLRLSYLPRPTAKNILDKVGFEEAEKEIKFMERNNITPYTFLDESYPFRLLECIDRPPLFYAKGNASLSTNRMISIVGTRNNTPYSELFLESFIAELSTLKGLTIVSGLAMGVDILAHKLALKYNIPTIGVMGTGMRQIYPEEHKIIADKMLLNGALVTEFHAYDSVVPGNFPRRNRIIAGLSDATIVVETKLKGGSVITANIANSYNREVFAVPGRTTDPYSIGCNFLIKTYKAIILNESKDLLESMGWTNPTNSGIVKELEFANTQEKTIYYNIKNNPEIGIDSLAGISLMPNSALASILLDLELEGRIKALPGKRYKISE